MRPDRDIDVLLDAWLAEGPLEAPDRILDVVADRVHRRRPEPAWRLAWRDSRMNTAIKPILAAAAVLVLSVAGVAVIMNQPSPGIGGPEATPTPIASPSPSPSPSSTEAALCQPTDPSCLGPLAAGRHSTSRIVTPFTFEVPEGWSRVQEKPGYLALERPGETGIVFISADPVAVDQELCSSKADASVGTSAEDLVGWLTGHPGLTATEPAIVSLGGLSGWTLEAEMRDGWDPFPCPLRVNLFSHDGTAVEDDMWWQIDAAERMRLTILDAGDHVVMIDVEADKADFDAVVAEAAPVVESFDFE